VTKGLIVGTGPSLRGQLDLIPQFDGLVFICNNSFQDIAGDVWLACDPKWHALYGQVSGDFDKWHWDKGICEKYGYKYVEGVWMVDSVAYSRNEYECPPGPAGGLWMADKTKISLNHCSGAQLLNLAANQYGCDPILLAGHDFRYVPGEPRHFFKGLSDTEGEYPPELRKVSLFDKSKTTGGDDLLQVYKRISEQQGLPKIINVTPGSALPWFEMGNLEDHLR
jgi:hypothetical protein